MSYNISLSVSGTVESCSGHLYLHVPGGTAEQAISAGYNGTAEQVLFDLAQHLHAALSPEPAAPAEPQPMQAGANEPSSVS